MIVYLNRSSIFFFRQIFLFLNYLKSEEKAKNSYFSKGIKNK